MTSWELEARSDRRHFKSILEARGAEELRNQVIACVAQVEFADGMLWIPSRATLADPKLARVAAPSPEEQRSTEPYRKKGLNALVEELKRFQ